MSDEPSAGIIRIFQNPPERLKNLLSRRKLKTKERAELLLAIELGILKSEYRSWNSEFSGPEREPVELEDTFVDALRALEHRCWKVSGLRPGDTDFDETAKVYYKTVRLYNSLFHGLGSLTDGRPAISRLGGLQKISEWLWGVMSGYHIHRPIDWNTARQMWILCESARFLPPLVTPTGLRDAEAELKFSEAQDLRRWFERRFSLMPETFEEFNNAPLDYDRNFEEEKIFEAYPDKIQQLIITALGGVVSLELMARMAEAYPTEHILNLMVDELICEIDPLLAWLDFGHVLNLSTLYACADELDLTSKYAEAGAPVSRRPKLVWSRVDPEK